MRKKTIDPIVLAEDCVITGGIGETLPNYNVLVVGCSGTGKSLSVNYPTLYNMQEASVVATFSKAGEARLMAEHFRKKGYRTMICDLSDPERSEVSFDPLRYVQCFEDINDLANQSVCSVLQKTVDDYWNNKARPLIGALISAAMMLDQNATFADVLELFDRLRLEERRSGISTGLDETFSKLAQEDPDCYAVREFLNFHSLPYKTASCVRDTAASALSAVYPHSLRKMMRSKDSIDFRRLATERTALFIITSPLNSSLYAYANMIYGTCINQLLAYAAECDDQRLPRPVRLVFDDFAVGAKIQHFAEQISIFRSAGISTVILLQSESQLYALYGDHDGKTILNNVSTYCYFAGGMDLTTCEHVARRTNQPLDSVLYAPLDRVYVMQAGRKPRISSRYPILQDRRYLEMTRFQRRTGAKAG